MKIGMCVGMHADWHVCGHACRLACVWACVCSRMQRAVVWKHMHEHRHVQGLARGTSRTSHHVTATCRSNCLANKGLQFAASTVGRYRLCDMEQIIHVNLIHIVEHPLQVIHSRTHVSTGRTHDIGMTIIRCHSMSMSRQATTSSQAHRL